MRHMWLVRVLAVSAAFLVVCDCAECVAGNALWNSVGWKKYKTKKNPRKGKLTKSSKPCEWVKTLEAAKAAASTERPIYMYFSEDVSELNLPDAFRHDEQMQKISQTEAVFVLMWIPEEPTPQDKEMLKKYGVAGSGRAVIADAAGNPIVKHASTRSAKALARQLKDVREKIKKAAEMAEKRFQQAEKALASGQKTTAILHLNWIVQNCSGTPEAEGATDKLAELNTEAEAEMKAILEREGEAKDKKLELMKLRTKTHSTS